MYNDDLNFLNERLLREINSLQLWPRTEIFAPESSRPNNDSSQIVILANGRSSVPDITVDSIFLRTTFLTLYLSLHLKILCDIDFCGFCSKNFTELGFLGSKYGFKKLCSNEILDLD